MQTIDRVRHNQRWSRYAQLLYLRIIDRSLQEGVGLVWLKIPYSFRDEWWKFEGEVCMQCGAACSGGIIIENKFTEVENVQLDRYLPRFFSSNSLFEVSTMHNLFLQQSVFSRFRVLNEGYMVYVHREVRMRNE